MQNLNHPPSLEPHPQTQAEEKKEAAQEPGFWSMALGSLGIVYGDIGTSPLYALQEAAKKISTGAHSFAVDDIYGIISLIFWTLTIIVTLKYVLLVLRNDNEGEGGLLTLATLANQDRLEKLNIALVLGLLGAALFYGDAAITPAISVMSAVGGLAIVMPKAASFVMPASFLILCVLFLVQKKGTQKIGWLFGPIMATWMLTMAALALPQIWHDPGILRAISPLYGLHYLAGHGLHALGVLAMVFLAVTGAEALYADLGHFGRRPIRVTWLLLVFPCLIMSYLGQASLLLHDPQAIKNPFVLLAPHWAMWPVVILGTLATIIASQAVISGAYSLASQAFELGLLPRMKIICTNSQKKGQIYIPQVNHVLMAAVLLVVLIFRSSHGAAAAYGIAVTGTMLTTSLLMVIVIPRKWKWPLAGAIALMTPFILVEAVFLTANLTKVLRGGWLPLLFAAFAALLMVIWVHGMRALRIRGERDAIHLDKLTSALETPSAARRKGVAVFLSRYPGYLPKKLAKCLEIERPHHSHTIITSVIIEHVPQVPEKDRFIIEKLATDITAVTINLGYIEDRNLPHLLSKALGLDLKNATYFLTRRILSHEPAHILPQWQTRIFAALKKTAISAQDFYCLPPKQTIVIEKESVL